jgi:glyoxylase-like metal-dependent hydrolase (beta-lactamase superfamily II)
MVDSRRVPLATVSVRLRAAATVAACLAVSPAVAAPAFDVEAIAPGVSVYRNATAGFPGANSTVVERADGLLVIDAQPSPQAAKALLAQLAKATKKPVRYLVLTHPHAESWGGASAFPPGTLIVASDNAAAKLADAGYDAGGEWRARAADTKAWTEPPRALPVLHASGPITLDDPARKVVVYPLPRAHSSGDLYVAIPDANVIAVGGLVVSDKNPFAGDAEIRGWIGVLAELIRDDATVLVPCAGRTVRAPDVRLVRDALAWVRGRVQQAFTDLTPTDEVVAKVLADPGLGAWLAPDARPSFARSVVEAAFHETVRDRKRRNLP